MRERIKELEQLSQALEPDLKERNSMIQEVQAYLNHFYSETLDPKTPVFHKDAPAMPYKTEFTRSHTLAGILSYLKKYVDKDALNAASPKHLGYVPGGGIFAASLGDYIGAATNKYVGIYSVAPNGVQIENMLIEWTAKILGFDPKSAGGNLTSGGSIANLTAIIAARDSLLELKDFHRAVIYTTDLTHHCIHKALRIAGFRANHPEQEGNIRYIDTDENFNLKPEMLASAIREDKAAGKIPFMIVANAGTTNFGNIDPLDEIGEIAQKEGIWYHIDAAYGGYFVLSDAKERLKGIEKADTVVLDAHKSLFLPYGLATILAKDREKLFKAFYYHADYLDEGELEKFSPSNVSPELTKPFRGLRLWLPLRLHGLEPFVATLNEKLLLSQYCYNDLKNTYGIELSNEPELSIFAFRYIPTVFTNDLDGQNRFNQQLMEKINDKGEVYFSPTTYQGKFWIRIAILSFRSRLAIVDKALEVIKAEIRSLEASYDQQIVRSV